MGWVMVLYIRFHSLINYVRTIEMQFAVEIFQGTNKYGGREHNALQEVKLPVWSNNDCDRAYFQPITSIFLCAGYPQGLHNFWIES